MAPRRVRRFALKVKPIVKVMSLRSMVTGGSRPIPKPLVKMVRSIPSGDILCSISPSTPPRRAPVKIKSSKRPILFLKMAIEEIVQKKISICNKKV